MEKEMLTALGAALGVWILLFIPIFGSVSRFFVSLYYVLRPDMQSALKGDLDADHAGTLQVLLWLFAGIAVGGSLYAHLHAG